jgi:YHS domain-containing protein
VSSNLGASHLILTGLLALFVPENALAAEQQLAPEVTQHQQVQLETEPYNLSWLERVEADHVCMVTNKHFSSPQISVEVEGRTYYGCCSMCKGKLESSSAIREGIDPISGNSIDKSVAVIGSEADGTVHYFENEENMKVFDKRKSNYQ